MERGAVIDAWITVRSLVDVRCTTADEIDPPTLDGETLVAIDLLGVTECESEIRIVDKTFEES